uniref:Uncharacterized protein n=1 Tax=Anguilla anguilla TaxID=7936 RepID=A0A0E9PRI6_ANGAN
MLWRFDLHRVQSRAFSYFRESADDVHTHFLQKRELRSFNSNSYWSCLLLGSKPSHLPR